MKYEKVVYISHPYGGKEENRKQVGEIIKELMQAYPNYLFLSPIHAFSYAYSEVDYNVGLSWCLWLLDKSQEMWVYGDYTSSEGCKREIQYCLEHNIPIRNRKRLTAQEAITAGCILINDDDGLSEFDINFDDDNNDETEDK
jgi:hypothetical protein